MLFIKLFFLICISLVMYPYFGYPILLLLRKKFKYVSRSDFFPTVTLLTTAYNEEKHIGAKINNSLNINYPEVKLQILVVSDGSTDKTVEIARSFKRIEVLDLKHSGKTIAQNEGMKCATGEIIVFSDANNNYEPEAIKKLIRNFSDKRIGVVCGELKYNGEEIDEGLYWKYERMIKRIEAKSGSLLGANGSIYAIRKNLFIPLQKDAISDFIEPILIYGEGYHVIYEPEAIAIEEKPRYTFNRKRRIILRSLVSLKYVKKLLNPISKRNIFFTIFSHKIIRWLVPVNMLLLFIFNLLLIKSGTIYLLVFILQILFYLLGFYIKTIRYFLVVNLASIFALFDWMRGEKINTWKVIR